MNALLSALDLHRLIEYVCGWLSIKCLAEQYKLLDDQLHR